MQNVLLTIHLILAVLLTGVVLLQRSEGGGLGMGGGGGGTGVMTGRQAANALTRLTWIFGIAIFVTSIGLTIIAAQQGSGGSIMDQLGATNEQPAPDQNLPDLPAYTPPPVTGGDPLTPPAPDAPATQAPATQAPAASTQAPAAEPVTPPAAQAPAPETGAGQAVAPEAPTTEAVPAGDAPAERDVPH